MLSPIHEALVDLVRAAPVRIIELARDLAAGEVPADLDAGSAVIVDPGVPTLLPPARMCDLALEIPLAGRRLAVLLEVQLRRDVTKELSWPLLWAAMHARTSIRGGPVLMLVITPHRATERWANAALDRLIPTAGSWAVLGPSTVPRVAGARVARRDPELALLSAMMHAGSAGDLELVPAIAAACSTVPTERGMLMHDVIAARLGRVALAAMEAKMTKWKFNIATWQSPIAHKLHAEGIKQGLKQGREEGRVLGAKQILFTLIDSRRLALKRTQRTAVDTCRDLALLQLWTRRAVTADTSDEIFATHRARRPRGARPTSRRSRRQV